jgi:prepilin-type N-terminal cleavage/methylation domain-containing protein
MKNHKCKLVLRRAANGVTLIEMVAVVAIAALLASVVIGIASRIDNRTKEKGLANIFVLLESALQEYHEYTDKFPEQAEKNFTNAAAHSELLYSELHSIPSSQKVLEKISDSLLKNKTAAGNVSPKIYDPWGIVLDYRYVQGDTFPELISAGPDKVFGTTDDISSKK